MKRETIQLFFTLLVSFFIFGCNSNDDCDCAPNVIAEVNETIAEADFEQGVITNDTTIEIKTEDKELLSTITLTEDTQFEDENGVAVTETPILVVESSKKETESTSEIKFVNSDGETLIPTKPFKVAIKAPAGAKPGDRVQIEVPDDGNTQIQKFIIRVVQQNGFIILTITITEYKKTTTIVVVTLLGNGSTN
jgi:hypothetical protein